MDEKERSYLETCIIQLSMYYMLATTDMDEYYTLKDCTKKLNEEINAAKKGSTIFHVKKEHIINKLYDNLKDLEKEQYIELLRDSILKMNFYYNISKDNSLMSTAIEDDVEELAYNILYFNKGTDELKKMEDMHAQYELGERYFEAEMDKYAYEYFVKAAEKGHKLASYRKIICIYKGYGIGKNEELAFTELKKYTKDFVYSKAELLLGEMYFEREKYEEAFKQFEKMENWEAKAKFYLALMYMGGLGIEKDEDRAKDLMIEAVNSRNRDAINYVLENGIVLTDE